MLSIRLDEDLEQQIESYAKHGDQTKTEVIKAALIEFFSNHNQAKAALKQSERIAKFEKDTDYIKNDKFYLG